MKTGLASLPLRPGRLLTVSVVTASIVAAAIAAVVIHESEEPVPIWALLAIWGLCLAVGLGVVAYVYVLRAEMRFIQRHRFKSLRSTFIYAVGLATLFTVLSLYANLNNANLFFMFYLAGFLAGASSGAMYMRSMRGKIVGDKFVTRRTFDPELRTYWKEYLILIIFWTASVLLSREVFHSNYAWLGAWTGLFMGMILHIFVWVYVYEKRNKIRITFQYSEPRQPVGP